MEYVFVYGTLKFGFSNYRLLWNSQCIGRGYTIKKYDMYSSGIPYVIEDGLEITKIYGEVYLCNENTMRNLDMLEGHPTFYKRKKVDIKIVNGKIQSCWIYFYQGDYEVGMKHITNGIYNQTKQLWK